MSYLAQIPTRAYSRVRVADLFNPTAPSVQGLLNPSALRYSTRVDIGELSPVNWPHSVLMYGNTKSTTIPLEFYFSDQLTARAGGSAAMLIQYTDWFQSFCYPNALGEAPPPMLVIWPKVLEMVVVVASFDANITRFHNDIISAGSIRVTVEARELRHTFRTAGSHRTDGLRGFDTKVLVGYAHAGSPMNLKPRGGR